MAAHKDLTGVDLHEPKGVATADSGAVYVANGSGSGVWTILDIPEGTFTMQQKLYTSGATSWSKPANLMFIRVFLQGGGAGDSGGLSSGVGNTSSFGALVTATGAGAAVQSTGDLNSAYTAYLPWAYANQSPDITDPVDADAGNWATKVISAASLSSSHTVTVGAGNGTGVGGENGLVYVEEYILI